MDKKISIFLVVVLLILIVAYLYFPFSSLTAFLPSPTPEDVDSIKLPEGFSIEVYAENVPGARSLELVNGTLFVGSRSPGKVYAIKDGQVITIAEGLNSPNGVAFHNDSLYVAEISRVIRFKDILSNLEDAEYEVVNDQFPKDRSHGWKFIAFGPEDKLYVPVGAPCNVCDPEEEIYSTITRMNPDGSEMEIYAEGIRNTVGFDWHPETKELWFTDNGRDWLGDNRPPDELNRISKEGMHFGFPYCHGKDIEDPEFGRNCNQYQEPEMELGPHVAALGMRFYNHSMFPEKYRGGIFIAEHGSWNRKVPIGYRITFVPIENNSAQDYEVFAEGWLSNGISWGRPVDVEEMPDGSLLVSDDKAGTVYRIFFMMGEK